MNENGDSGDTISERYRWLRRPLAALFLACAWIAGVSVIDIILDERVVLVALLGVAPVVAALWAPWKRVVAIGFVASGSGLALGVPDGNLESAQHLLDVAVVVSVSVMSAWVALLHDRTREARTLSEYRAHHDSLTGTLTRRALAERVEPLLSLREAERPYLAVLMVDIDFFKKVNDTYGHASGDDVLQEMSSRVHHVLRRGDLFSRWGGEEFLVVLVGGNDETARQVADRIREVVADAPVALSTPGLTPVAVTVSLGGVSVEPSESFESAVSRADVCLYAAKEPGRDRITWGDAPSIDEPS